LGDSFHDAQGPARLLPDAVALLGRLLAAVEWHWITGNHDGGSGAALGGSVHTEIEISGIALRHEALAGACGAEISGHFHPKVSLALRSGVRVSRRCLALTSGRLVLPAYGAYAGGLSIDDPAFAAALGARPEAVVALAEGLIRLPPREQFQ
jgi:metallophosphoesterase superfamily enzyme